MAGKRTTKGDTKTRQTPAQLSLVEAHPDSAEELTPAQKRLAALARGRAKRMANRAEREANRPPDFKSNLKRYMDGEYPVSEWTDREVQKGRPEGRDGFGGPFPNFNGKQHAEIKRELLKRGQRKMDGLYTVAIKALAEVAEHGENESARVKAAQELINRTAGKTPDRVEIKSSDPWQDILDDIMNDEVLERVNTSDTAAQADS